MSRSKKKTDGFDSTMSLGDHLEELRTRLILALVGLAVCAIVSFCFGPKIISIIEKPYISAMGSDARLQTLPMAVSPLSKSL